MVSFILLFIAFMLNYSQSVYFPSGNIKKICASLPLKKLFLPLIFGAFVVLYFQRGLYTAIFIWLYQMALVVSLLQITVKFLEQKIKQNAR